MHNRDKRDRRHNYEVEYEPAKKQISQKKGRKKYQSESDDSDYESSIPS